MEQHYGHSIYESEISMKGEETKEALLGQLKQATIKFRSFGNPENPKHDWSALVVVGFIITVILLLVGLYLFIKIDEGTIFNVEVSDDASVGTVSREGLKETLVELRKEREKFDSLIEEVPAISDPS